MQSDSKITEADWKAGDADWQSKGVLKKFHQSEFLDTYVWQLGGLAPYGYIYYPYNCYDGSRSCKVHMYLRGCGQTVDGPWLNFRELYYGGWFEYAAANDIILLMPQAKGGLVNPIECFELDNYNNIFDAETLATYKGAHM